MSNVHEFINRSIRLDSTSHTIHLEMAAAATISFQVFQKIEISIRVKECGAGNRALAIALVVNGKDFGQETAVMATTTTRIKRSKVGYYHNLQVVGLVIYPSNYI